ncbi:MAG TPA: hypothetical protein ENJ27_02275 [Candidatus Moranbacteria bacterium]|nr:hypothetical protein [Candidatus Moranbacteria bacterium]
MKLLQFDLFCSADVRSKINIKNMQKKLQHKKIYDKLCRKFDLVCDKGSGGIYPTNYTLFYTRDNYNAPTPEPFLLIEKIPAGKYMKTIYCMFINGKQNKQIYSFLVAEYKKQRENERVEWVIDNNQNWKDLNLGCITF